MPHFLRFLTGHLLLGVLLLASCTKKTDPDPQPGSVSGQVAPVGAIATVTATGADGRTVVATPNATGGAYQTAGAYQIAGLAAGSYVLSFTAAAGYQAPASVTVVVAAGTVTQVPPVTALASAGGISGQATPANALTGVAATDAAGRGSATSVGTTGAFAFAGLAPGTYTVSFAAAAGFQAPANVQVVVAGGQTAAIPPITVAAQTRAGLLVGRNWRVSAATETTGGAVVDIFALARACARDNFIRFSQPNGFVSDEGPTKCDPLSPQTETGTWTLVNGDNTLVVRYAGGGSEYFTLVALTATTLHLRVDATPTSAAVTNTIFTAF